MVPRILILGSYPPPFGGISTHIRGLVPRLEAAGYGIDVLSPGRDDSEQRIGDNSTVYRLSKDTGQNLNKLVAHPFASAAHVMRTRMPSKEMFKSFIICQRARKVFVKHRRSIKLISAYMVYPWGFAGAILAREFGVPLVTTNFGELFQSRPFYLSNPRVARDTVRASAALMASSKHCAAMYETCLGMEGVDVQVVPYGVEKVFFDSSVARADARRQEGFPEDRMLVLYFARMNAEMGLDTWLETIKAHLFRDACFHFVIAGAKGELTPAVLALAGDFPNQITVRCDVPFDALARYYAASDVVVAPSADERTCMGITIKESMASSRAVVASDIGGIGEAVEHGVTGLLVEARNPAAFALALRQLAEVPHRCDAMGAQGRARALKMFTMEATNERVAAVFERVMRS
jgi:glycosyltransferase involved in cell wall biosynthesis